MSISIHALLAESDGIPVIFLGDDSDFYPRSPCGERRRLEVYKRHYLEISIHALLAESDDVYKEANFPGFAFLSTLSLRRATR